MSNQEWEMNTELAVSIIMDILNGEDKDEYHENYDPLMEGGLSNYGVRKELSQFEAKLAYCQARELRLPFFLSGYFSSRHQHVT